MEEIPPNDRSIKFTAVLHKVQTIATGGFRLTLDLTSQDADAAMMLLRLADMPGLLLKVTAEIE